MLLSSQAAVTSSGPFMPDRQAAATAPRAKGAAREGAWPALADLLTCWITPLITYPLRAIAPFA